MPREQVFRRVGVAICMLGCAYSSDSGSAGRLMIAGGVGAFLGVNIYTITQSIAGLKALADGWAFRT